LLQLLQLARRQLLQAQHHALNQFATGFATGVVGFLLGAELGSLRGE